MSRSTAPRVVIVSINQEIHFDFKTGTMLNFIKYGNHGLMCLVTTAGLHGRHPFDSSRNLSWGGMRDEQKESRRIASLLKCFI